MVTFHYLNNRSTLAKHRTIACNKNDVLHIWVIKNIKFRYGFGGVDESTIYIDVDDWNKFLQKVNDLILDGYRVFRLQEKIIKE